MVDQKKTLIYLLFFFSLCFSSSLKSTLAQRMVSPPSTSPAEKSALLAIRSSLGLRSNDWPLKGDPCLNWNGIRCENGSVIGINISGFKRTRLGQLNPRFSIDSIINLTHLISFNASKFLLLGSIPNWFGLRLLNLQVLDLSSCSITSVIPISFGNLTNLRILDLSDNNLTGTIPSSLSQLNRLSILDLSKNSIRGSIPLFITTISNLSSLDLSSNSLSGLIPPSIGTLSKLQYLNLSSNGLSSSVPPSLGELKALVDLDLSLNQLSGSVPSDLKGLRNLQNLIIHGNLLSGSLPIDLFDLLSKLQVVDFSHNGFIGTLPNNLWSLPQLIVLDLSNNHFSDSLPNLTVSSVPTVLELNISANMFYGNLTTLLRRFHNVDLSGNFFEGKVPDFFPINASISNNCLQNVANQRELSDCSSFYSQKGLTFDNFGQPSEKQSRKSSRLSNRTVVILAAVGGAILVILILILLPLFVNFCIRNSNRARSVPRGSRGIGPMPQGETFSPGGVSINFASHGSSFTYQQLLMATKEFNEQNLIKKGHSGDLFKGVLESGIHVLIKRIGFDSIKSEAYLTELDFFSRVTHPRIIPLVGHCLEGMNEKFLVYKYMPNGNLVNSLFRKPYSLVDNSFKSLDWITRLKIALGAAEGLSYLHHDCSPPIVHRDVQASSILLDDRFEVRLGSLSQACVQEIDGRQRKIAGLLRLSRSSRGSSSSYSATATCTYDVYCFGKILLELITGRLGISSCDETQFRHYLDEILPCVSSQEKEPVMKILDRSLVVNEDLLEEVWAMAIIARSCLNPRPSRRPLMRHIVQALENPMKVVRVDSDGSGRFRIGSSMGSSSGGLSIGVFGSWRQSSSDAAAGMSNSLSLAEGPSRIGATGSSIRESSGDASSRRHAKDV